MIEHKGIILKTEPHWSECPYCRKPVGLLGNWFAVILGTQMHGCDFSNTLAPKEQW